VENEKDKILKKFIELNVHSSLGLFIEREAVICVCLYVHGGRNGRSVSLVAHADQSGKKVLKAVTDRASEITGEKGRDRE
jgi:hypothetical protein